MTDDHLSKREDRALHRTFESVVLTQFPNPERKDCPGIGSAAANRQKAHLDAAIRHLTTPEGAHPALQNLAGYAVPHAETKRSRDAEHCVRSEFFCSGF